MNNKVLIAYATKCGAIQDTAKQIAQTLQTNFGLEVNLVDLQKNRHPDVSLYETIIVASGIRMGKWYKEPLLFLKSNFEGKKVAVFVSAMYQGENPKTYPTAVERYLKAIVQEHLNVEPIAMEVFGGRMKFAGRVTAENRDINRINNWAQILGEKITNKIPVTQLKGEV